MIDKKITWAEAIDGVNECLKVYPTAIKQINLLEDALGSIANWDEHSDELAANQGFNGVRDFYRNRAIKALEDSNALLSQLQEEKG